MGKIQPVENHSFSLLFLRFRLYHFFWIAASLVSFHIPRLILEKCWAVWPADKTFLLCVKKRRLDWHLLILTDHTPTLNYRQSSLWSVIIFYSLACFPDVKIEEHPVISLQCLSVAILTFSMHRKMCIEFIENIYNQKIPSASCKCRIMNYPIKINDHLHFLCISVYIEDWRMSKHVNSSLVRMYYYYPDPGWCFW